MKRSVVWLSTSKDYAAFHCRIPLGSNPSPYLFTLKAFYSKEVLTINSQLQQSRSNVNMLQWTFFPLQKNFLQKKKDEINALFNFCVICQILTKYQHDCYVSPEVSVTLHLLCKISVFRKQIVFLSFYYHCACNMLVSESNLDSCLKRIQIFNSYHKSVSGWNWLESSWSINLFKY